MTTPSTPTAHEILWPKYDAPSDLVVIEEVPLADRGLPATTYELLVRAADLWPSQKAVTVLPDADRWEQPRRDQPPNRGEAHHLHRVDLLAHLTRSDRR
jgi:hypothetical protein